MERRRIIDAHAHIYPEKISQKAVVNIADYYDVPLSFTKKGTAEHLLALSQKYNVEKIVVSSVATNINQVEKINDFIAYNTSRCNEFIAFGTLHPDMTSEELQLEIARIKSLGMFGIKLHPDCQKFKLTSKTGYKMFENMDASMPVLLHTGDYRGEFSNPNLMVEIAKAFPHLTFICGHFGAYSEWEKADCYSGINNIYFDTSSSLRFLTKDRILHLFNTIGIDRFLFGTDYPLWGYAEDIAILESLGLTDAELHKIFYGNAARLFNLNDN